MIDIQLNEFSATEPIIQVHDEEEESVIHDSYNSKSETTMIVPPPAHSATNSGALQAWKTLLKQHPWSVSDPGPPSFLVLEVSDRKYSSSSPLLNGGVFQQKGGHDQADYHQPLLKSNPDNEQLEGIGPTGCFGTVKSANPSRNLGSKALLKWVFIVLNVAIEACQAALTQEEAQDKLRHHIYAKLSIVTSSVCLMLSLVEAFHEARSSQVVWQKRGSCCCYWFYYPGPQGKLFGKFSLYFGTICSMVQLILNLITMITGKDFVKFDYVPLLLSVGYLVAAAIASQEKASGSSLAVVKCRTHGYVEAEATIVNGRRNRVYACPECQRESLP